MLAVRRFGHFLGRLRLAGRPGTGGTVGAEHEPDQDPVPDPDAGDHLHPGLAAGVDGDHRHLHADLRAAARQLRRRPTVLRPAGGAEPADGLPQPAGGHVGLLPEGGGAAARDAEPDLPGHAAVHGHPDPGHRVAVHLSADRPLAAAKWPDLNQTASANPGAIHSTKK